VQPVEAPIGAPVFKLVRWVETTEPYSDGEAAVPTFSWQI